MRAFATVVLSATAVLSAQTPESPPIPYVASVKVNASGSPSSFTRRLPGGTFLASNMTAHDMIAFAHGLQPFQVEGGADWIRMVRFDITIRAETNVGPVAIGPTQIGLQLGARCWPSASHSRRTARPANGPCLLWFVREPMGHPDRGFDRARLIARARARRR